MFAHSTSAIAEASTETVVSEEVLVDAIVASVNGKPITLQEVLARLTPRRSLTLKEASQDPEARETLEALVLDRLIQEDAAAKHISVSEAEINSYIEEVAQRNSLTREQFTAALAGEGKTIEQYVNRIRVDILRSKIIGQYIQSAVSVSSEEVEKYLEDHPNLKKSGAKIKLSRILLAHETDQAMSDARVAELQARIAANEDFSSLARQYSQGPESKEGGLLGVFDQTDLSPEIFDAVFTLTPGQVSKPITTAQGVQLFRVDSRQDEESANPRALAQEEAKVALRQQKVQERMYSYFTTELPKLYAVEKKL